MHLCYQAFDFAPNSLENIFIPDSTDLNHQFRHFIRNESIYKELVYANPKQNQGNPEGF